MAKRKKSQKKPVKVWKIYNTSGKLERKNKFCPKCGKGFFMARHKGRMVCGHCFYTEFESGKVKEVKEKVEKPLPEEEA